MNQLSINPTPDTDTRASERAPRRRRYGFAVAAIVAAGSIALGACGGTTDGGAEDPQDAQQALACGSTALTEAVHEECAPMDAVAEPDEHGSCLCMLGFAWNGEQCVQLADCQCVGPDCNKLTETLEECEAAHSTCN